MPRGRKRAFPQYAHLSSAEYAPLARKIRRETKVDVVFDAWNRAYGLCYRRGLPRPTLADFRAGLVKAPPLLTTEQLSAAARAGRFRFLSQNPAYIQPPIAMSRPRAFPRLSHLYGDEYTRASVKLRHVSRRADPVYREWNRVYLRCYRRGIEPPTIEQVRAGQYELPSTPVAHHSRVHSKAFSPDAYRAKIAARLALAG